MNLPKGTAETSVPQSLNIMFYSIRSTAASGWKLRKFCVLTVSLSGMRMFLRLKMKNSNSAHLPKDIQDYLSHVEAKRKKAKENAVAALQHRECVDDRTAAAL